MIEFGYTWGRRGSLNKGSPNWGDRPFQVLERISDNPYKIDIPGNYGISYSFNVVDLTPFIVGDDSEDLRANAFQEGGND